MARNEFVQAAYIVPDLAAGMERWRATMGVGPFFVMRDIRPENGLYRGKPDNLVMQIAMAQAGRVQIELVEQLNDGPSVYRDVYPAGSPGGFHHLCYFATDLEEEVRYFQSLGAEAGFLGRFGDVKFGYFDTRAQLGCFTEVLEEEPGVLELFRMVEEAGKDWDGRDPVRELG